MNLKDALKNATPLISDGGVGAQLQQLGLEPGGCADEWNLSHPEKVAAVHQAYLDAGAQLITTSTFSSNHFVLANYGLEQQQADIARAGAQIAKRVVGDKAWVMGSIGFCGGFLAPLGEIDPAALEESVRVQVSSLLEGGADAIVIETLTALDELEITVRTARKLGAPLVFATGAFDWTKQGPRTMMGVSPEEFARVAVDAGADAVGANCGTLRGAEQFADLGRKMRSVVSVPLLMQPNGGKPTLEGDKVVYPISPEQMAEVLMDVATFAQMVGGCCGVTPDHIRAFHDRLRRGASSAG